jgi:Glutaminase/Asparaginase C-terminal domain
VLIYPGVQDTQMVARQLQDENLKAAIVLSFGSGNIPTKPEFLAVFKEARDRGVVLAIVTQCSRGPVELGIYDTSAKLLAAGFVSGTDLTPEAAQTKLMVLLGDPDLKDPNIDPEERQRIVERQFEISMAGEQRSSIFLTDFGDRSGATVDASTGVSQARIRATTVEGQFAADSVQRAILRLRGCELKSSSKADSYVQFRVFLNLDLDPNAVPDDSDPGFGGVFRRWPADSTGLMVFDITEAVRATVRAGDRVSVTVVCDSKGSTLVWERAELAVFASDESS